MKWLDSDENHMASSFVNDLEQFSLAIDIVNDKIFNQVGRLVCDYFENSLQADMYEVRVPGDPDDNGNEQLRTLWIKNTDFKVVSGLRDRDGKIKGHTSYAVLMNRPLWIVSKGGGYLRANADYEDLWSHSTDIPSYRGWPDANFRTSVIIPFGFPSRGYLNLEFQKKFPPCMRAKEELRRVAKIVRNIYRLNESQKLQTANTDNVISSLKSLKSHLHHNPLLKPKMFFAYSQRADKELTGIIKSILSEYSEYIEIVDWDELYTSGDVRSRVRQEIVSSEFGICYFSEFDSEKNIYVDNANVIFEAGMFYALKSLGHGESRWIPIREENSSRVPFDIAGERFLYVRRKNNALNKDAFSTDFKRHIDALLGNEL